MDDILAPLHSTARRNTGSQRLLRAGASAKARAPRLSRKMRADDAFRAILSDCLAQATAQAGVLRAGRSAEALHHLRVAMRRLEVMLDAFGTAFGQAWFADLRGRTKAISARLAPARDLDVFLDELWPNVLRGFAEGRSGDFGALRRAAEAARDAAWQAVEVCLASEDFGHLLDDIAALSQSRLPMGGDEKLIKLARRLLKAAAQRVRKRGKRARSRDEGDLHRLRIALKKLRYLAQIFAPLHQRKPIKSYLAALKRLQEQLGGLNDIVHVRATITDLLRGADAAQIGYGAGLFAGYCAAGRSRRAKKTLRRYDDFRDLTPFWKNRD
jgi:triphosphatase